MNDCDIWYLVFLDFQHFVECVVFPDQGFNLVHSATKFTACQVCLNRVTEQSVQHPHNNTREMQHQNKGTTKKTTWYSISSSAVTVVPPVIPIEWWCYCHSIKLLFTGEWPILYHSSPILLLIPCQFWQMAALPYLLWWADGVQLLGVSEEDVELVQLVVKISPLLPNTA